MSAQKITILGGGSPFVPSLIYAMIENKEVLNDSEVCLMDINPDRLPTLIKLGEVLSRRENANIRFTSTTNPEEALKGAAFVIITYRIGGVEHMKYDIEIPTKHGVSGDETTGPGGTFMTQCTIPITISYCRMIEDLCPDSWVISHINPANAVADAVRRETGVKFISLCDGFAGFSISFLPRVLDMSPYERRLSAI